MLKTAPQSVLDTMAAAKSTLCIIGRNQKISALPPFAYLKNLTTFDGRPYDDIAGVGAVVGNPNTAVSEANLLWLDTDGYTKFFFEIVTVHEMAHAIEDIGISAEALSVAKQTFSASLAKRQSNFTKASLTPYGWQNHEEYWAVMTEARFKATSRTDINAGILTPQQVSGAGKLWLQISVTNIFQLFLRTYGTKSRSW